MTVQLIDLVHRFDTGEILLPLMQRDYIWKPPKVINLLDSLYRRWPIGCFYVWHTKQPQKSKDNIKSSSLIMHSIDGFYGFLLDGQQRLTSLSLGIAGESSNMETRAFFDVERCCFFLGGSNKTVKKRIASADPGIIPLSDLIPDRREFDQGVLQATIQRVIGGLKERGRLNGSSDKETEYRTRLFRAATMLHQDALCEEFHDDHVENAIELFARLNKGGTTLKSGDVEAARLSQKETEHIVNPMRGFVQSPSLLALGLNFVFVTRSLVTVHRGTSSFTKLPRNWAGGPDEIVESWKTAQKGLHYVVKFVRDEMGWATRRWLPSANALIPIVYLFKLQAKSPSREERDAIKRYLLITGLRGLFRGSVETSINKFVNLLKKTNKNKKNKALLLLKRIPKNQRYKIKAEDIKSTSGMYSPLMQIYLAYLVSKNARSWPSGYSIREAARGEIQGDPISVHHIFPKKFMALLDFPLEKLNTMANYAILTQSDNATLSDQDPATAYGSLSSQERGWASLQLFFKAFDDLLDPQEYEEF